MKTAIIIFMALFWIYALGIMAFAVWTGIQLGRAKADFIAWAFLQLNSREPARHDDDRVEKQLTYGGMLEAETDRRTPMRKRHSPQPRRAADE